MLLPISTLSPFVNVIIVLFYGTLVWICANAFCIFICIQRADIFTQYTKKYLAIFLSVSVYAVFLYLCRWVWKYINIHNEHAVILFCVEWTYRSNYNILIIESPLIHMHATPWPLIQMSISISSDNYLVYVFRITYMSTIHFHHIHTNNPFLTLPKPLNPNFIFFFLSKMVHRVRIECYWNAPEYKTSPGSWSNYLKNTHEGTNAPFPSNHDTDIISSTAGW